MVRIETAQPLTGYRLKVRFNDGLEGIYPVEPERRGGVFLKLLEAKTFNAVTINPDFGCVEWPGGIDLCPDTMHQAMTGSAAEVERPSPMALRENSKRKP
ncbi:MAG: DUF2442 domain-containing protein [Verrucomicrobia bacterium]|nr:DUF2442 domain-containing protein [Verrucomicrobiota bacterium]